ncbi:MAG: hypothetical protein JWR36_167 [Glaciihabitans sp.]|nr:hypothetical protein [Glaciihabitans sp.]
MSAAYPSAPAVMFASDFSPAPIVAVTVTTLVIVVVVVCALLVGGALTPSPTAVSDSPSMNDHGADFQFDGLQLPTLSLDDAALYI